MLRAQLATFAILIVLVSSIEAQDQVSPILIGVKSNDNSIRHIHSVGDGGPNSAVPIIQPVANISPNHWNPEALKPSSYLPSAINQSNEVAVITPPESEESGSPAVKFGGWIQTGFHSNSTALFNDRPDKVNLQQLWFYLEREAAREFHWDWGFRVDLLYGTDAQKTQAFGNPAGTWDFANGWDHGAYGWALPQAYAELANEKVSLKMGHFFTLIGYEVVTAPDNFFYSHAYTMFNSEPFTHTGLIASYDASDSTTIHAGWTLGWDTGFNQLGGGSNFLGGFSQKVGENLTFTYMSTAGNFGWRGSGYSHSLIFDRQLSEKLNYIVQSDLVSTDQSGGNNNEVGLNQYLLYTLNERWRAGTRIEWWKSDISGTSQSTYALTGGLNFTPGDNLIIRPEVRYNWGADLMGADMETPIFGIDAIITF